MKKLKFQHPQGMHDILPDQQKYFKVIYETIEKMADFYGFGRIETPIPEQTELFSKGVGQTTDIVYRQMYSFKTKKGDSFTLRPEGTAPVVRAFIEHGMHNLPQPVKLWYFGPYFRHERPQSGRFRQFWQFGFEIFGEQSPVIDAQMIQILYNILKELGLKDLIVEVNSIGDGHCRPYYKKVLVNYLRSRQSSLCGNCRRRIKENPLRILDCKEEKCQPVKSQAPQIVDHLCDECRLHFRQVLEFLDELELPYRLNPHLVRGLDYYTKTVFEFFQESRADTSFALGGGGRYDNLTKLLGGKDVPACGGAMGIERIITLLKEKSGLSIKEKAPEVFLSQLGDLAKRKSLNILEDFRKAKIKVLESFGRDSLKAQLSKANKLGVRYNLILGHKEALNNEIIIRDMKSGSQSQVKIEKVVQEIKKKLKKR